MFAMESTPGASPVQPDIMNQSGVKAGIWTEGAGNCPGHANGDVPASGRTPLSTLDKVVASMTIGSDGKISLTDYFEPYDYISMDAGDRDLGSGAVSLLDPTVFKCTGVFRIAVTVGKNAKVYIMNANNLGGFKQGSGGVDNVLRTIIANGAVFGGVGSYPLEGGYLYFTAVGYPIRAYKIGLDASGQAGTGILWICGPITGLRAFNAVPNDGVLTPLSLPATGGLNKFQRPAFGDERLYISDGKGTIICLGSPVALPLNCTQPVDFGDVPIGSASTKNVSYTANIAVTSINGCMTEDATFQCSNSTLPKGSLAQGAKFGFSVTWNLTTILPVSLTGSTISQKSSFLNIATRCADCDAWDLGRIVVGSDATISGLSATVMLSNVGVETLVFQGLAWTEDIDAEGESDKPVISYNVTGGDIGDGFSSSSLPCPEDTLAPRQSIVICNNGGSALQIIKPKLPIQTELLAPNSATDLHEGQTIDVDDCALITSSNLTFGVRDVAVTANIITKQVGSLLPDGAAIYAYLGCYCNGSGRLFTKKLTDSTNDNDYCQKSYCNLGYSFAGTKYHTECWCGNTPPTYIMTQVLRSRNVLGAVLETQTKHAVVTGHISQSTTIVQNTRLVLTRFLILPAPQSQVMHSLAHRVVGPYSHVGCYAEPTGARALTAKSLKNDNMSVDICANFCAGYIRIGLEYRRECYCGNTLNPNSIRNTVTTKYCSLTCIANTLQICGGSSLLTLHNNLTVSSSSSSSSTSTVLSSSGQSSTPSTDPSISTSISSSSSTLSSSTISSLSTTLSDSSSSTSASSSSSSVVPTSSDYQSSTISTTSTVSAILGSASIGCSSDTIGPYNSYGMLKLFRNDSMTPELCISSAFAQLSAVPAIAYRYIGVEYGPECYAASVAPTPEPTTLVGTRACTFPCKGDTSSKWGGRVQYNMYVATSVAITGTGTTQWMSAPATSTAK
ncbi:hypothetical protein BJ878DRAFT_572187 [Calycina marina]|uniref:WSC domain-containing protein n=1 Tax=Calycina marina TaxID=1763456 RepID=A0A9P7ZBD4_9HELO|nr:hypothetical protein BJ878DRAFT_572187 [Calycina marina]